MKKLKGQDSEKIGRYEFYRASDGYRWRLVAANGQNIANGGESFSSRAAVIEAIHDVIDYSSTVVEDRPERLLHRPSKKRGEIMRKGGTIIIDYDDVTED